MPFRSQAQQRFMFATMPATAREWAHETPDIKGLPKKITTSDPAVTRKKNPKPQPQEKVAGIRVILEAVQPVPVRGETRQHLPTAMVQTIEKAARAAAWAGKQVPQSPESHDSLGARTATTSVLGGVIHTPETEQRMAAVMQKLASTRLRADFVAQRGLQRSVAKIGRGSPGTAAPIGHVKQAVVVPPGGTRPTPMAQAQQQMMAFMPTQPLQAGQGIMVNGLDAPNAQDAATHRPASPTAGTATAVPGMAGSAAANVIDKHGPLDPRGLTLDGNHASGVAKGFKIAGDQSAATICRQFELDLLGILGQTPGFRGKLLVSTESQLIKQAMDECYANACKPADNEWGCTCKGKCKACAKGKQEKTAGLAEYDCPYCGGTAYNGNPRTGDRYRGSGECADCGGQFSIVGMKLQPREKKAGVQPLRALTDDPSWQAERRQDCPGCESSHSHGGGRCKLCGAIWQKKSASEGCESSHSFATELWRLSELSQLVKAAFASQLGLTRRKPKDKDTRRAGLLPWAATAVGAGALGLANGIGSDQDVTNAVQGFNRMNDPLRPNTTMLTQYADSMSGAARLAPFGLPVTEMMPKIREQGWLMGKTPLAPGGKDNQGGVFEGVAGAMGEKSPVTQFLRKGIGIPGYTTDTPELQHGARAHYQSFAQGPLAAVSHMMRGPRGGYAIENQELTGGKPTTYKDYYGPRFEKFVRDRTGGNMLPNEIDTKYLPQEEQVKWLQDFHASLSPAEQAEKARIETDLMGGLKSENTQNYKPLVEGAANVRQRLKDVGFTAGGAGLGGLAGSSLYRALTNDDEESTVGHAASTAAGMGLGGAAGYFGGTEHGRQMIGDLVQRLRGSIKTASLGDVLLRAVQPSSAVLEGVQ